MRGETKVMWPSKDCKKPRVRCGPAAASLTVEFLGKPGVFVTDLVLDVVRGLADCREIGCKRASPEQWAGVSSVVIGGLARVIRGSDELTWGVDICPSVVEANRDRVAAALDSARPT